jgi:hypothetical protein
MVPIALLLLFFADVAAARTTPELPFQQWGACPTECCRYGPWRANSSVTARTAPGARNVAFSIARGERVDALTGVVITREAGVVVLERPYTVESKSGGNVTLPANARVYVLHNGGEGVDSVWYRGATYRAELYATAVSAATAAYPRRVLSVPRYEWWVKVRNGRGKVGWVRDPLDFLGQGECG